MSWNYRVMRHTNAAGDASFTIHEVYYTSEGMPAMYSVDAVAPYGDTIEELQEEIGRFAAAFDKPIMTPKDFPAQGAEDDA